MDHLPSINVEPEGWDSWVNIVEGLWGYGATLVTLDGTEHSGFLGGTGLVGDDETDVVFLKDVDKDWDETGAITAHPVDSLRAITIH